MATRNRWDSCLAHGRCTSDSIASENKHDKRIRLSFFLIERDEEFAFFLCEMENNKHWEITAVNGERQIRLERRFR